MINLNDEINLDDMPMCPLCDLPMLENDEVCIIFVHDCKGLVHTMCMDVDVG